MERSWTLMSSHGLVLFSIAARPNATMRELSQELDLTERRVAQIVRELSAAELIAIRKAGRRNLYSVKSDATFRHPTLSHIPLSHFERVFSEAATEMPAAALAN